MNDYSALPDPDAEAMIYGQMRAYDDAERLRYAQIGLMALAVDRRLLWKHRMDPDDGFPCRSFARWVRIACPYAYSTVYAALRDVESLQDVPADDLAQIPQSNFGTMKQLSTKVRGDKKVLAIAKTGKTGELVAYVKANHADQHLSHQTSFRLTLTEEQRSEIEEAIEAEIQAGDGASPGEVVFGWAVNSRLDRQNRMMNAEGKAVAHA